MDCFHGLTLYLCIVLSYAKEVVAMTSGPQDEVTFPFDPPTCEYLPLRAFSLFHDSPRAEIDCIPKLFPIPVFSFLCSSVRYPPSNFHFFPISWEKSFLNSGDMPFYGDVFQKSGSSLTRACLEFPRRQEFPQMELLILASRKKRLPLSRHS